MGIIQTIQFKLAAFKYRKFIPETVWVMEEHKSWGNNISWLDFNTRRISGHTTPRPKKGDELRCEMNSGAIARFEFVKIEYCHDPHDMFFATVKDIGFVK